MTRVLNHLAATRGLPLVLRTDNGPEFCGRTLLTWAHERGLTLRLIEPGQPNQNAYIDSFNGRLCDERPQRALVHQSGASASGHPAG